MCRQQNYPINCNFRRASSKHLITLTPKIYPFFSKSLSKISSANGLPGLLPVGQVRRQSYLPEPKIYLSRTTGRGLFRALCRQTIYIFATLLLGNTLRTLMTSYWLPRQHARSGKEPFKLQLLKIIGKTKSVTYRFYFFVGNLPKFFNLLESMTKIYLVEFKIYRKMAYYSLQKIVLDRFPRNFFI